MQAVATHASTPSGVSLLRFVGYATGAFIHARFMSVAAFSRSWNRRPRHTFERLNGREHHEAYDRSNCAGIGRHPWRMRR